MVLDRHLKRRDDAEIRGLVAEACLRAGFPSPEPPRMLNPSADPALPLHVQSPGARLRKSAETLVVETEDGSTTVPLIDISEVALYGPVSVTTPALHELMRREIPVAWHSTGGWLLGHTSGAGTKNVAVRAAQFALAADPQRSRRMAAGFVAAGFVVAKIRNQRTLLRRNWKGAQGDATLAGALDRLKRLAEAAPHASDISRLLGVEGEAAAIYFALFPSLIAAAKAELGAFSFEARNRRPPADPINALLSFSYALATRLFLGGLVSAGFDPDQGSTTGRATVARRSRST